VLRDMTPCRLLDRFHYMEGTCPGVQEESLNAYQHLSVALHGCNRQTLPLSRWLVIRTGNGCDLYLGAPGLNLSLTIGYSKVFNKTFDDWFSLSSYIGCSEQTCI
jgi:hypothetical protein